MSRSKELLAYLKMVFFPLFDSPPLRGSEHTEYARLIILGDLFNDLSFTRLNRDDWKLLSFFRKLTNEKRGVEVIWVEGNHDKPSSEIIAHLLGVELVDEFEWEVGEARYVAIHGHQFDSFIKNNPIITNIACGIYFFLQLLDKRRHRLSRYVKKSSKQWLGISEKLAEKALVYGKLKQRTVICGHTHQALSIRGELSYFNSGCWTDIPSTFVIVDMSGVSIYSVDGEGQCTKTGM